MAGEILGDRIFETTTTTGTGTVTLLGAPGTKYVTFKVGLGIAFAATTAYCIYDDDNFEVGFGTLTPGPPDTLSRSTILASSNSNAAVNWGPGTRNVICTIPGSSAVFKDATGKIGQLANPLRFQSFTGGFSVTETGFAVDATIWHSGRGPSTLAAKGYQKLPSGLIVNWGTITGINTSIADTYAQAFTTVFGAQVTWIGSSTGALDAPNYTTTASAITVYNPNTPDQNAFYVALGI